MKIKEMQLYVALNEFIEKELMPLGSTMDFKQQCLYGVKIELIKYGAQKQIKKFLKSNAIKQLELLDENGNIEIQPLYEAVISTVKKMGKFEIDDFTFRENDLQNLYNIAQKYATQEGDLI